ncbi:DUF120 domain-containing protein [Aromatoleum aromaticum]|uniref:Riboflavin kinase n=1 Tax=Aromatoleum aromaticum (strain DSM 19018 / LMG 30748 / EbN1) TaxID=76114 RepID=Q5P484_AROAE|nr:DUF120 domain-containing protein [Aromatoleum aromaticum]NMG53782.1 DUF120 domain-containing protein [Aromatoleum aromaticum]CAI07879.1 hypothetical protein ebA3131 [Aromatoleum aromaticum EbN1]
MRETGTTVKLQGVVCSGLGEGTRFTTIDWVVEEFRTRLGFAPCPGTFNLRMDGARWEALRLRLLATRGIAITPRHGLCAAKCFPVRLAGRLSGALVLPDMDDYPPDKLEVIAPLPVRHTLGLADGDAVQLHVVTGWRGGLPMSPCVGAAPHPLLPDVPA